MTIIIAAKGKKCAIFLPYQLYYNFQSNLLVAVYIGQCHLLIPPCISSISCPLTPMKHEGRECFNQLRLASFFASSIAPSSSYAADNCRLYYLLPCRTDDAFPARLIFELIQCIHHAYWHGDIVKIQKSVRFHTFITFLSRSEYYGFCQTWQKRNTTRLLKCFGPSTLHLRYRKWGILSMKWRRWLRTWASKTYPNGGGGFQAQLVVRSTSCKARTFARSLL